MQSRETQGYYDEVHDDVIHYIRSFRYECDLLMMRRSVIVGDIQTKTCNECSTVAIARLEHADNKIGVALGSICDRVQYDTIWW